MFDIWNLFNPNYLFDSVEVGNFHRIFRWVGLIQRYLFNPKHVKYSVISGSTAHVDCSDLSLTIIHWWRWCQSIRNDHMTIFRKKILHSWSAISFLIIFLGFIHGLLKIIFMFHNVLKFWCISQNVSFSWHFLNFLIFHSFTKF